MTHRSIIEKAIKAAKKQYPDLQEFDNPYERIAEFLPDGGYGALIPEKNEENSFQWAERVEEIVDTIWTNL